MRAGSWILTALSIRVGRLPLVPVVVRARFAHDASVRGAAALGLPTLSVSSSDAGVPFVQDRAGRGDGDGG